MYVRSLPFAFIFVLLFLCSPVFRIPVLGSPSWGRRGRHHSCELFLRATSERCRRAALLPRSLGSTGGKPVRRIRPITLEQPWPTGRSRTGHAHCQPRSANGNRKAHQISEKNIIILLFIWFFALEFYSSTCSLFWKSEILGFSIKKRHTVV